MFKIFKQDVILLILVFVVKYKLTKNRFDYSKT